MVAANADVAGVVARPPLLYLGFLLAGIALDRVVPLPAPGAGGPRYGAGALLVLAGVALMAAGIRRFRAAGTNVQTTQPTTALATDGPYRWSRNPLYVSLTLFYAGIAMAAGSVWALVGLVPLLAIMRWGVIAREEAYLERKFGAAYRAYKARVRRWL
jgi:protein-S-isoprenylcysteine O-methyltransferase Ste14